MSSEEKLQLKFSPVRQWTVVGTMFLCLLCYTYIRFLCSAFITLIIEDVGLNGAQQGFFTAAEYLVSIFTMFVGFYISNALGKKWTFVLGTALLLPAGICLWVATWPSLIFARIFIGLSVGMSAPMRVAIVAIMFGDNKRASQYAIALLGVGGYLGRFLGMATAYPLLNLVGSWQNAALFIGVVSIVCAILFIPTFKASWAPKEIASGSIKDTLEGIKEGAKYPIVRKFAAYFACSGFGGMAFNMFIMVLMTYKTDFEPAALAAAAGGAGLGGLIGASLGGIVAANSKVKYVLVPAEFCSFAIMAFTSLSNGLSIGVIAACLTMHGFFQGAQSTNNLSLLYKQKGLSPTTMAGATSFVMTFFYAASFLSLQLFGIVYPHIGPDKAMLIWAIPVLIGAIIVTTMKEPSVKEIEAELKAEKA